MNGFKNGKMPPITSIRLEESPCVFERKVAMQVAESFDNAVMAKMVEIAREEGFTDLVLIDKEFVVTALKNEIERRKDEES